MVALARNWRFWWRTWLEPRAPVWVGMLAVAAAAPLIISNVHPRPSYLFGLGVFLMAGTGMSVFILTRRFWLTWPVSGWIQPVLAAVVLPAAPSFYLTGPLPQRPLYTLLRRMEPFTDVLQSPATVFVAGDYGEAVSIYVGRGKCRYLDNGTLTNDWPAGMPLQQVLTKAGVNALYLDNRILGWMEHERAREAQAFLGETPPAGWRRLGGGDIPGDRWRMYQLVPAAR
jgi:hypothetical protein